MPAASLGGVCTPPGAEQMMAWLLADAILALRLDAYHLLGKPADWLGR